MSDQTIPNSQGEVLDSLDDLDADGPAALVRETERLVRDNVTARPELAWTAPIHVLAQVTRPGDEIKIQDLEKFEETPARSRGSYTVFDAESFVTLVGRLRTDQTTLWAHQPSTGADAPSITAVLNDAVDADNPGWRDHRATLVVRVDPDWAAWAALDGKGINQVTFAEFLGDHLHNITAPAASGLIRTITMFEGKRNVTWRQAVNLDTGETEWTYIEKDSEENAGKVRLPTELTLTMRPYFGADPVELTVALRHRVSKEGGLTFFPTRIRPDLAEEKAWEVVAGKVSKPLSGLPMLQGSAPASLRP